MNHGKFICEALKQIRIDIARANGIRYSPFLCHHHEGDCAGTCPACESEMRYLEREIAHKRSIGKAALVAGVSLALSSLSGVAAGVPSSKAVTADYGNTSQVCDTTKRTEVFGAIHEQMPYFRGGERALMKYLSEHVQYPPEAVKDSIQGRVVVQLLIGKAGEVSEVKVVRSAHELLDNEAVRVCKSLPKFFPGRRGGETISVWLTLPVTFTLQDKQEPEKPKTVEVKAEFPGDK